MVLARQRYEEIRASIRRLLGASHYAGMSRAATYCYGSG